MAESIDVSPQYLCRLFSNILRMRPFEYLTKFRIQKAKELLLGDCNIQISEVSKKIGYNDLSYFCALFKKFEGITPMEYRKVYKL